MRREPCVGGYEQQVHGPNVATQAGPSISNSIYTVLHNATLMGDFEKSRASDHAVVLKSHGRPLMRGSVCGASRETKANIRSPCG